MATVFYLTTGTLAYARSSFPIRCSASGFGLPYFPPTSSCMQNSIRPRTERNVPSAARPLYLHQTASILPGLPEADYPQTGSRAHEEKTRSCYAVGAKKALFYAALTAVLQGGNILILIPLKSRFYCVTETTICTHRENGRGGQHTGCRARSFLQSLYYRGCCCLIFSSSFSHSLSYNSLY